MYLEADAVASKLKYTQQMWTQVVACVFLFTLQWWHYKCVEMITFIFKMLS